MKFQVGDKVVIQHSNEKGEIVEIINDEMVLIDVRGVKFPAYTDQLDFPYYKRFTEKSSSRRRKSRRNMLTSFRLKSLRPAQKKNGSPNCPRGFGLPSSPFSTTMNLATMWWTA